jgi:hypothetical protein
VRRLRSTATLGRASVLALPGKCTGLIGTKLRFDLEVTKVTTVRLRCAGFVFARRSPRWTEAGFEPAPALSRSSPASPPSITPLAVVEDIVAFGPKLKAYSLRLATLPWSEFRLNSTLPYAPKPP